MSNFNPITGSQNYFDPNDPSVFSGATVADQDAQDSAVKSVLPNSVNPQSQYAMTLGGRQDSQKDARTAGTTSAIDTSSPDPMDIRGNVIAQSMLGMGVSPYAMNPNIMKYMMAMNKPELLAAQNVSAKNYGSPWGILPKALAGYQMGNVSREMNDQLSGMKQSAGGSSGSIAQIMADNSMSLPEKAIAISKIDPKMGNMLMRGAGLQNTASNQEFNRDYKVNVQTPLAERNTAAREQMADSSGQRAQTGVVGSFEKLTTPFRTPSNQSAIGRSMLTQLNADRALEVLNDNGPLTNYKRQSLQADWASIFQNGSPTEMGLKHSDITTLESKVGEALQFWTAHPQNTLPEPMKKDLIQSFTKLKTVGNQYVMKGLEATEKSAEPIFRQDPNLRNDWKAFKDEITKSYGGGGETDAGKQLDQQTAVKFLNMAKGDKNQARALAKQQGYTF